MGDLVVARKGRVDDRAAAHDVSQYTEDDQVANDHAHRSAQQWINAAAVTSRANVTARRADGGRPLQDHLPREQDESAGDVETVGKESTIAGVRSLLRL